MSPGLARGLKQMKVSSESLTEDPVWQAVLRGYAALLQMTIADVETKHALSRHWADRPFPTITAKHINREACVCVEEARSLKDSCMGLGDRSSGSLQPDDLSGAVKLKTKQARGKSAVLCFRDDFLRAAREIAPDGAVNPCSKEFWAEFRQAWASLSDERKAYYAEMAAQSQAEARQARASSRQQGQVAAASSMPAAPPSCPSNQLAPRHALAPLELPGEARNSDVALASYNPWVLASEVGTTADIVELARKVSVLHRQHDCKQGQVLADDVVRFSPVSEAQLETSWRNNIAQGRTWAQTLQQYNVESQRFTVPPADDKFPTKVTYHGCCGILCRNVSSPIDIANFQKILAAFNRATAMCGDGTAASSAKCDILIRFRLHSDLEEDVWSAQCFSFVTACSARSGVHAPSQIFVACRFAEQDGAGGQLLRLEASDNVPSRCRGVPPCSTVGHCAILPKSSTPSTCCN